MAVGSANYYVYALTLIVKQRECVFNTTAQLTGKAFISPIPIVSIAGGGEVIYSLGIYRMGFSASFFQVFVFNFMNAATTLVVLLFHH